jgi:hypothetical protein
MVCSGRESKKLEILAKTFSNLSNYYIAKEGKPVPMLN